MVPYYCLDRGGHESIDSHIVLRAAPARLVQWTGPKNQLEACHRRLRSLDPAVVGRMNQEGLALDVRTIADDEFDLVAAGFAEAWRRLSGMDGD